MFMVGFIAGLMYWTALNCIIVHNKLVTQCLLDNRPLSECQEGKEKTDTFLSYLV